MKHKRICRYRQKPAILLLTSFQILPIGQNNPALPLLAEPDCMLYFVFQVVGVRCFRCNEGIECELCSEAEAGDEAIEGGLTIDGCPGIDVLEESFFLFSGKLIREEVLAFVECLHIVLHLFILLKAASLRVDVAVVKLFDKMIHGSFSLFLLRNPCVHAVKM